MPFENNLKRIFESGLETFNEADYENLISYVSPCLEFIAPAINLPHIKSPAVHLKKFEDVIKFWSLVNSQVENRITRFEYLKIGKNSLVRCYYDGIGLVLDTEIIFDSYGIVTKIFQQHLKE